MTDAAWIDSALTSARPQAVGALLRYFRDLDTAEEAFQDACLRALKNWPVNGPPRDPAAWLIMVGRNAALDGKRRTAKQQPLPEDELISDLGDAESALAVRLDGELSQDDVFRFLFVCPPRVFPPARQIAQPWRIAQGLSKTRAARLLPAADDAIQHRTARANPGVYPQLFLCAPHPPP